MSFTPEQITEILQIYFDNFVNQTYTGMRYVPIFGRRGEVSIDWDNSEPYEPLTIVTYNNESYTSRQFVPAGASITDTDYWAKTGAYNAQIIALQDALPIAQFDSENTVKDYIDELGSFLPASDFDNDNTVKAYIDEVADLLPSSAFDSVNTIRAAIRNHGAKALDIANITSAPDGVYTLGDVTIDNPIQFSTLQHRNLIIVDSVIRINTPVLFPADFATSYFVLPAFVGCEFRNATSDNSRVAISKGSNNTVGSKFVGCNFVNVDIAHSTSYIQDMNFVGCYIQSHTAFLETATGTAQARFIGCNVESESNQLIKSKIVNAYFNGVFEGNQAQNWYFIESDYGIVNCVNAWIEGANFAYIKGSNNQSEKSELSFIGTRLVAGSNPILKFDDTTFVALDFFNTNWSPYNTASRICTQTPSDFYRFIGYPRSHFGAETYNYPFGGVSQLDREIATVYTVNEILANNIREWAQVNLSTNPISITLPVGIYTIKTYRLSGGNTVIDQYTVMAAKPYSTTCTVTKFIDSSDSYLGSISISASKNATGDTVFTLNVSATLSAEYWVVISK